jgi:hypothetical protein
MEELVAILQESTDGLHPLWTCKWFDLANAMQMLTKSTGSTASFKIHGKSNHILLTMALHLIRSGTHISLSQWHFCFGIFVWVAGVVPILTIFSLLSKY